MVIGAGIGGLVAALLLASRGADVTLLERAATPGGKLRQVDVGGEVLDCGPTVLTLRTVFEDIFDAVGTTLATHLELVPAAMLARHAWDATGHLDLFASIDRSADAIGAFAGAAEARGYRAFCARARAVFTLLDRPFIRTPRPSLPGLVRALPARALFGLSPFTTLWQSLGTFFADPRLRQLFGRYATYCGSSPFACPATLMLVAHVEQSGVWLVEGGMHRIATVLAALAGARGARVRYGEEVARIAVADGRASGVTLATGEVIAADAVVCNADVAAVADGLLGPGVRKAVASPSQRSLSAVTIALRGTTSGFPLTRHSVFFSGDYAAEFEDVFRRGRLPRSPTVYVCAQDRDDEGHLGRTAGPERLFTIVNAPPTGDTHPDDSAEMARCETLTFETLARCGLTVDRSASPLVTTGPANFHRMFPGSGGALYGAASHGWTASFRRPGLRSRVPGLYLCGGSTHPGPGLPMAALSGRMAAECLLEDWASTRRSPRPATPGGMSTP